MISPIYFITSCTESWRRVLDDRDTLAVLREEFETAPKRYGWTIGDGMGALSGQASARTAALSERGHNGGSLGATGTPHVADCGPIGTMPVGFMNLRLS